MVRSDLVQIVSEKAHLTKKAAQEAVDTFLDEIFKALIRGEDVMLSGFGKFTIGEIKKDKDVVAIGTGKRITVKAHHVAQFSPGRPLRKAVW
ncbi:HU family DNA-binding protein [Patescibacteria group bacterium]|nr:HU family DNA-binding protein [Patescibacteria group bacterium]